MNSWRRNQRGKIDNPHEPVDEPNRSNKRARQRCDLLHPTWRGRAYGLGYRSGSIVMLAEARIYGIIAAIPYWRIVRL
jgi:hypothetical protein